MNRSSRRLLIVVNSLDYFISHRLPVALAARDCGFDVHVATPGGVNVSVLVNSGVVHHSIPLSRSGMNPISELKAAAALFKLLRSIKPSIVHLVTIKPVLYGGVIARFSGGPSIVAAVSGLGFVFLKKGVRATIVRALVSGTYRFVFGKRRLRVIVQNKDDCEILVKVARLSREKVVLIRGSGVDLSRFTPTPLPTGIPIVVMAARLLRDKGVQEFVDAARLLRARGVVARFWLAGTPDPGNPASVSPSDVLDWTRAEVVEALGQRDDMNHVFRQSSIVVLPSYREGLPKVLLEAAACARAVITTDVPGCRDAIQPGISGVLIPARDALALADAVERLLSEPENLEAMGRSARRFAEREFSIEKVVASHLAVYEQLVASAT